MKKTKAPPESLVPRTETEIAVPAPPAPAGGWLPVAAAAVISFLLAIYILQVPARGIAVPYQYGHDSFTTQMMIKTMIDNGWWLTNQYLGAPLNYELHDYPGNPNLHFLAMAPLSLLFRDAAKVMNVYFLLSFPLVTAAAFLALRAFRVSRWTSGALSVLFALLPYHFWRNESHLFLGAYYMLPLGAMVAAWVFYDVPFLVAPGENGRWRIDWPNRRSAAAAAICVAVGLDVPYYPVFTAFLLAVAAVTAFGVYRIRTAIPRAAAAILLIGVGIGINMLPNLLYRIANGPNLAGDHIATRRPWTDTEQYALKPIQLILPAVGHRIPVFSLLRNKYYADAPIPSETDSMALGAVGSAGFLVLLSALIWARLRDCERGRLFYFLSVLTIAAILLGTMGGFGVLPSLLGFTSMRCYNRLSVLIALFSLVAAGHGLDAARSWLRPRLGAWAGLALVAGVAIAGVLDQTGTTYLAGPTDHHAEYRSDATFTAGIEASLPKGAMVFQMPYIAFGSYANTSHRMQPYSHFRGYFHSRDLRWSFGAMHGRYADRLQYHISHLPLEESIEKLAILGFSGIWVDRLGYPDEGSSVETRLAGLLVSQPLVSPNRLQSFFPMKAFAEARRAGYGESRWEQARQELLSLPLPEWSDGFWSEENHGGRTVRSAAFRSRLVFLNPSTKSRRVKFQAKFQIEYPAALLLTIDGLGVADRFALGPQEAPYERTFEVPPGEHEIRFRCPVTLPVSPQMRMFRVYDALVTVLPD